MQDDESIDGNDGLDGSDYKKLIVAELDAVYRLACHLTHSRQESDDCVQETYLRALKSASTFTLAEFGVRPWLFKILHNVIHTRMSKGMRDLAVLDAAKQQAGVREASSAVLEAQIDPSRTDCHLPIDWDDVDERLKRAIARLTMPLREVFLLSAVEGLKYREIADVVDVPVGTVMSRLFRARITLAEQLAELAAEQRLGKSTNPLPESRSD